jgi:hypothetical protein
MIFKCSDVCLYKGYLLYMSSMNSIINVSMCSTCYAPLVMNSADDWLNMHIYVTALFELKYLE